MTKRVRFLVCVGTVAVACAFAPSLVARAAAPAAMAHGSVPTVLKIDPVGPIVVGQSFTVTGIFYRHIEGGNAGIPNRGVKLYIEPLETKSGTVGKTFLVANVFSDKEGRLKWVVRKRLESGRYRLYFLYQGSPMWRDSVATTELYVSDAPQGNVRPRPDRRSLLPVQLSIAASEAPIKPGATTTVTTRLTGKSQTPLAGYNVYFHVPGVTQQRVTDADGVAVFVIRKPLRPGNHTGRVSFLGKNGYAPVEEQVLLTVAGSVQTTLAFAQEGDKNTYVGDALAFVAQLKAAGQSVPNQFVRLFLNGKQRYGARTDGEGRVELRLPRDMVAGSHVISATFRGTNGLLASSTELQITLLPRLFEVRTVPPLRNVNILVREQVIRTDEQGIARLMIEKSGPLPVRVLPYESPDPNVRAEFYRWSDGVFSATRKIRITSGVTATYLIGFEVSHPVTQRFIEEDSGREVSSSRLSNITLVNSAGQAVTLTVSEGGVQWLKANRIVRLEGALLASPVSYQLRNITVDGVNVVNQGQQRFRVTPNARWSMKLQMHDLAVEVRDALFGFPVGQGMRVAYPMGQFRDVALDPSGRMRIESLSRGSYTVTVQGVLGIRAPTPIALSRNQEVNLAVISYLDIGIVGGALALMALCVLFVGRRKVFAGLRQVVFRRTPCT